MSYIVNKFNDDQIAIVEDGTINTALDLKLVGKNYAGYGEVQNENFVFLLENFAREVAPPKKIKGQIWFDSASSKLKFFDGTNWRTTGGAEVGTTEPLGLTEGDFWWDTDNKQLNAWDGSQFILIGPQSAGGTITQMQSVSVKDSLNNTHHIIKAVVNSDTIFVISTDSVFTLNATTPITGFTKIQQGITLRNSTDDSAPGRTTSSHRFHGTATDADRLGGHSASEFVLAASAEFTDVVNFEDVGFSVGNPNERLWVYNESQLVPTIHNKISSEIVFKTTNSIGQTKTPIKLYNADLLPGENLASNIGSSTLSFNTIYGSSFSGSAAKSETLSVGGTYRSASTEATSGTIVARTSADYVTSDGQTIIAGSIKSNYFVGIATSALYADLAEKYLSDEEYEVGTVVMVGGEKEVTASQFGSRALGTVSDKPAYMMNSELVGGTYIALKGRVPVKVNGPVKKGDRLIPSTIPGVAEPITFLSEHGSLVFAIALENNDNEHVKHIEAVIL